MAVAEDQLQNEKTRISGKGTALNEQARSLGFSELAMICWRVRGLEGLRGPVALDFALGWRPSLLDYVP